MTPEQIIQWAKEAGFTITESLQTVVCNKAAIEAFANLVAAHEREQCAKVFDRFDLSGLSAYPEIQKLVADTLIAARELIHDRNKP